MNLAIRVSLVSLLLPTAGCFPQGWDDTRFVDAPAELRVRRLEHPEGTALSLVWGELEGQGGWYLLDSGAQPAVLDAATRPAGAALLRSVPLNGSVSAEMLRTGTFRIGRLEVADPIFFRFDLDRFLRRGGLPQGTTLPGGERIAGVLGYPILRHVCLEIGYGAAVDRVTLQAPDDCADAPGPWLEARISGGEVSIEGAVEGHAGRFVLDTGKTYTASLASHFAARAELHDGRPFEERDNHRIEGVSQEHWTEVSSFQLGGTELGPVHVGLRLEGTAAARQEGSPAGTVGRELLRHFVVTFDYSRTRVSLRPRAAVPPE